MWEPVEGRRQGKKEGNDEGKEGMGEGGKLTDEVNERPYASDFRVGGITCHSLQNILLMQLITRSVSQTLMCKQITSGAL